LAELHRDLVRASASLGGRHEENCQTRRIASRGSEEATAAPANFGIDLANLGYSLELLLQLEDDGIRVLESRGRRHRQRRVDLALIAARKNVDADQPAGEESDARGEGNQAESDDAPASANPDRSEADDVSGEHTPQDALVPPGQSLEAPIPLTSKSGG